MNVSHHRLHNGARETMNATGHQNNETTTKTAPGDDGIKDRYKGGLASPITKIKTYGSVVFTPSTPMRVEHGGFIIPAHLLSPRLGGQIIYPLNRPIQGGAETRDDAFFEFPPHHRNTRLRGRLRLNMATERFFTDLISFTLLDSTGRRRIAKCDSHAPGVARQRRFTFNAE